MVTKNREMGHTIEEDGKMDFMIWFYFCIAMAFCVLYDTNQCCFNDDSQRETLFELFVDM